MTYEIKIKTLADVQALEKAIKELDALEKQAKDFGNETKELSDRIARLDALMDSGAAVAIKQAYGWEQGAKSLDKMGHAAAAAELRLSASKLLKAEGLDPGEALVGEADKKRAAREMAAFDRREKRREDQLARELASNQKRAKKRIEAENADEAGTGPRGQFSLGGFLARAFGFGVGASAGAALAGGAVRDFVAELKDAFGKQNGVADSVKGVRDAFSGLVGTIASGVAGTGAFQKIASFTATTLTSWKMATLSLFPGQEKLEGLTSKNEEATRRFVTQLERAVKQQEAYEKRMERTNARLREQLAGLMAVKKASDSVDDAQAGFEKAVINEKLKRGQITQKQADAALAGVDSRAAARQYQGDHAAKEAEKESAQREADAARQSLEEKKRELDSIAKHREDAAKAVDADKAEALKASKLEERMSVMRALRGRRDFGLGSLWADLERPFTPEEQARIEERAQGLQDKQKTADYAATRDAEAKLRKEVEDGEKRLAPAEAGVGERNVELGAMEQVRSKAVATQNLPFMSDAQLEAFYRQAARWERNMDRINGAWEKANRATEDANARNANRRAF